MKRIGSLLIALALCFLTSNTVEAASLSETTFSAGDTITIHGDNFGTYGTYSNICFTDESSCYVYGNDGIISWSNSSIRISIPNWIYETGMHGKIYVYSASEPNPVATLSYTLAPMITGVYDEGNTLRTIAIPNETLFIRGLGFGNTKGRVHFPSADAKINSWTDTEISIVVPTVTKEGEFIDIWYKTDKYVTANVYTFKNITDDSYSAIQQYLNSTSISSATAKLKQGKEVVVAVIDDGIYLNHPDLKEKVWLNTDEKIGDDIDNDNNGYVDDYYGYDFVNNTSEMSTTGGHGTNVAGIIGAKRNNNNGIGGIAENVRLMSVIACDANGCPTDSVVNAINYAVANGADIINLSLSSGGTSGFKTAYATAIQNAYAKGVLIIAAAGNGDTEGGIGQDLGFIPQSPVCNDEGKNMVLGVGASDLWNEQITQWSNHGDCVDIYAPGETIFSTSVPKYSNYGDFYEFTAGTSFSSPIIAGLAATIMSAYPTMSASDVAGYIRKNTNNGLVNAEKVIAKIEATYAPSTATATTTSSELIFDDITSASKYATALTYLKKNNVIGGYPDGTFQPFNTVNRAELMKILIGADLPSGTYENCFKDVHQEWFSPYVCYAKTQGWIEGYADGTFKPAQTVNRAEAIKMAIEVFGIELPTTVGTNPYPDTNKDQWFAKYVFAAMQKGLFDSSMTNYEPSEGMQRGDVSEIIYRLLAIKALQAEKYETSLDSQLVSE